MIKIQRGVLLSYRGVLISMVFCSCLATSVSHAAGLGGTLQGNVTQDEPRSTYGVEIELFGDKGSVNYPSLRCGGRLDFVNFDGKAYWYRETITFGECIDGGSIELHPHPIEKNAWNWRWSGSGVTVRGVLRGVVVPDKR